jgi:hypothetical protein
MHGLQVDMRPVIVEAADVWADHGQTLVITSTVDSVHSPGSYHYYGYAIDFRTRYFSRRERVQVYKDLRESLPKKYVILLEKDHMHIHVRK